MKNDPSSIPDIPAKIKGRKGTRRPWFVMLVIFAVASTSFAIGRISILSSIPDDVTIEYPPYLAASDPELPIQAGAYAGETGNTNNLNQFVASKTGTKYYAPWCSGAARISEANKVWFASAAAAETAGYEPAANCPGVSE